MNKNIKIFTNYCLGPILFVVLTWSLYKQIVHQEDVLTRWNQIKSSWQHPIFLLVILLMFLNWGFETVKWQILMKPLQHFSFKEAYKAILAGCSITMLTPNRIGEYGGRILFVKNENKVQAISVTILGSIAQLAVTFLMGTLGIIYFKNIQYFEITNSIFNLITGNLILSISVFTSILLVLFYFNIQFLKRVIISLPFVKKLPSTIFSTLSYEKKVLLRVLLLSVSRYLIFILQYVLILRLMNVYIDFLPCVFLVSLFFMFMALAPTIGLIELPVRATAGWLLFGLMSNNFLGIQATVFCIWLINLVIPSLIGSVSMLRLKIFT